MEQRRETFRKRYIFDTGYTSFPSKRSRNKKMPKIKRLLQSELFDFESSPWYKHKEDRFVVLLDAICDRLDELFFFLTQCEKTHFQRSLSPRQGGFHRGGGSAYHMKGSVDYRLYICNLIYHVIHEMLIMIGQGTGFGLRQKKVALVNLIELQALVPNTHLKYLERIVILVVLILIIFVIVVV